MGNNVFNKKSLVSFIFVLLLGWGGWVSAGVIKAEKTEAVINSITDDVKYIRGRIDALYNQLLNSKRIATVKPKGLTVDKCTDHK